MEQDLFNFDDEPTTGTQVSVPAAPAPTWEWWHVWPDNLSARDQCLWQIRRDMRAFAEEEDEWWRLFFADRIALFQDEIKRMDHERAVL